jgi:hypothetical protein
MEVMVYSSKEEYVSSALDSGSGSGAGIKTRNAKEVELVVMVTEQIWRNETTSYSGFSSV